METNHPIKKKHEPVPHDPRNEPLPENDQPDRSGERSEKEVRKEAGVGMKKNDLPDLNGPRSKTEETEDEYGLPTGIRIDTPQKDSRPADFSNKAKPGNEKVSGRGTVDPKL